MEGKYLLTPFNLYLGDDGGVQKDVPRNPKYIEIPRQTLFCIAEMGITCVAWDYIILLLLLLSTFYWVVSPLNVVHCTKGNNAMDNMIRVYLVLNLMCFIFSLRVPKPVHQEL